MIQKFDIPQVTFVTCDVITASKPDPESLLLALKRLQVTKDEAAVLGDHWVDMQAGRNAAVHTRIGIAHGFDSTSALEEAGATMIVHSLTELTQHILDTKI